MANLEKGLSDRKKLILKAVVEAHIESGEPVGSKYIMQNCLGNCSSATIRNEMAELEALGYLEQPHTSAGRVPSELGYRLYVDSLVEQYAKATRDVVKLNQLLKIKMAEIDQILEHASKLASAMTNYTGLAIKPRQTSVFITKFEIVSIDEFSFVLIMITSGGAVKTKKVKSEIPLEGETLARLSDVLNANLVGLTSDMINLPVIMRLENEMEPYVPLVNHAIKSIYEVMNEIDSGEVRLTGVGNLLSYPEYSDAEQFGGLLATLEQQEQILQLASGVKGDDINVLIGSENSVKVMNNSSLVFKPIKKDGTTLGIIGVLGPRRMNYKRVLNTLEEIGGSITSIISENDEKSQDNITDKGDGNAG